MWQWAYLFFRSYDQNSISRCAAYQISINYLCTRSILRCSCETGECVRAYIPPCLLHVIFHTSNVCGGCVVSRQTICQWTMSIIYYVHWRIRNVFQSMRICAKSDQLCAWLMQSSMFVIDAYYIYQFFPQWVYVLPVRNDPPSHACWILASISFTTSIQ